MSIFANLSSPEKREKFLLVVAGLLLVFVIGPIVYGYYWTDMKKLRNQRAQLITSLEKLEKETQNAVEIKKRLEALTAISLPSNDSVAQSAYQNWLLDQARGGGLREIKIDQGSIAPYKDYYKKFTVTLHGRASLEQLATFLERFQRTDHLQLIRSISIRPLKESREMDVSIKVESIALRQAKPSTALAMRDNPNALGPETEKKMRKTITDRALFSAYVPPAPSRPAGPPPSPPPSGFAHSPYCFVEAIVEVDGKPQVWFNVRTEGKQYRLYEGEMFRLDGVRCIVKKIEFDRVVIEARVKADVAGDLYTIKAGKAFAEYED